MADRAAVSDCRAVSGGVRSQVAGPTHTPTETIGLSKAAPPVYNFGNRELRRCCATTTTFCNLHTWLCENLSAAQHSTTQHDYKTADCKAVSGGVRSQTPAYAAVTPTATALLAHFDNAGVQIQLSVMCQQKSVLLAA